MLLDAIFLLERDPLLAVVTLITFTVCLVIAITVHEASHALAATTLGDHTARNQGRLSLNPKVHLDPLGAALIMFAGFGWGKPTPVNPARLRLQGPSGMAVVSLAGPVSNIVTAIVFAVPLRAGVVDTRVLGFSSLGDLTHLPAYVLVSLVFWNLLLAAFNLLPIAPLDGFKFLLGILPPGAARNVAQLEQYGPGILVLIIMLDYMLPGPGILASLLGPVLNVLSFAVLGRDLL
ncbi:MAG: site-2 protease family protein [SAR202 cluster bacterium]|nr:site-2 protease family protein [SAR202 cluster bacterium]MDP6664429.1 site-2 protease family protein [SAR202 cluster bacterium]MDP6799997.1 site-2 protease family protein [SAR202 cluster bacterium]